MCQVVLLLLHFHLLLQRKTEALLCNLAVIFLTFHSNFFYTQLAFVFHLQENSYIADGNALIFQF